MAEPRERNRAVGRLVVGQFAHHFRLRAGVREHVDEVENHDVQVVLLELRQLGEQFLGLLRIVDFVVRKTVVTAESLDLRADEWTFVEVLAFFLVLIDPEFREHFGDLVRHQTRENRVSGVLRRRRQDAHIEFFADVEHFREVARDGAPLVVAEVVDDNQKHLLALVQHRENAPFKNIGRHQMAVVGRFPALVFHPIQVVLLHEFRESDVGLFLLRAQNLGH